MICKCTALIFAMTVAGSQPAVAADLNLVMIQEILAAASPEKPAVLAGKDLSDLDLSRLNFRNANLVGASLFASKLVQADFGGADLSKSNLNGAWLMGTNLKGANLAGSSMLSLVTLGGIVKDRPNFSGADLSGARMIADLDNTDFSGARLVKADLGVHIKNQGMGQMRTDLTNSKFIDADLSGIDLNRSVLSYAKFTRARLVGAILYRANLSGADLSDADLSGADFTEANLDGTILKGAKGLDTVKGMETTLNRDKAMQ